ncbi:MAG: putative porin [Xanthomonadales bacterium]|nr:putative porin [Xanthomonadales bacterium]
MKISSCGNSLSLHRIAFALVLTVTAQAGIAQRPTDDSLLLSQDHEQSAATTRFVADLWLNQDHVSGLPNNRDNLNRSRGRLRFGMSGVFGTNWDFTATARIAQGSDDNLDNRRNNDNERSDGIGVDQVLLRWHTSEMASLQFGKAPLPLDLSPMLWDPDLRPAGIAYEHSFAMGDIDRLHLVAGYFAGQHLYGDNSRIATAQVAWRWRDGAPTRASATLSWLGFSDLGELAHQGLGRTNALANGAYVSDYRLLDMQLAAHTDWGNWPIDLQLDVVRNLGADFARDGARLSLSAGDHRQPGGVQFGVAIERIQREAVLAAFNSDDWWFHSNMHGQLAWIAYGIDRTWNLRLSGFRELRDGLDQPTHRLRLDLNADW